MVRDKAVERRPPASRARPAIGLGDSTEDHFPGCVAFRIAPADTHVDLVARLESVFVRSGAAKEVSGVGGRIALGGRARVAHVPHEVRASSGSGTLGRAPAGGGRHAAPWCIAEEIVLLRVV